MIYNILDHIMKKISAHIKIKILIKFVLTLIFFRNIRYQYDIQRILKKYLRINILGYTRPKVIKDCFIIYAYFFLANLSISEIMNHTVYGICKSMS